MLWKSYLMESFHDAMDDDVWTDDEKLSGEALSVAVPGASLNPSCCYHEDQIPNQWGVWRKDTDSTIGENWAEA